MIDTIHEHLTAPFTKLLERITQSSDVSISSILQQSKPRQGASNSEVTQYAVMYQDATGAIQTAQLIIKNAKPLEQQLIQHFIDQKQPIPPAYIPEISETASRPIYMQHARSRPMSDVMGDPNRPIVHKVSKKLAKIHADNRLQCPEWLPKVADDPHSELYLSATWGVWDRLMQDNRFYTEYRQYDKRLRQALEQFLDLNRQLTAENDTLTIINSDLHPDHIRLLDDEIVFIDWEQACYGSLYLDLVNYFSIETALFYRDALAEQGYKIPTAEFMERFHAAGRFMGLRHLEIGLLAWEAGDEQWQAGRWFFHYCLTLALNGR